MALPTIQPQQLREYLNKGFIIAAKSTGEALFIMQTAEKYGFHANNYWYVNNISNHVPCGFRMDPHHRDSLLLWEYYPGERCSDIYVALSNNFIPFAY